MCDGFSIPMWEGDSLGWVSTCMKGHPFDGTESALWWDSEKKEEVDMDEVRLRWKRHNREVLRRGNKERWCENCGRSCKGNAGLKTHLRFCAGRSKRRI